MNFRLPPSKFKNQILTAQKRDQFHSELDLTKEAIGNDGTRTVQANSDTVIFSCGHSGVGIVPLKKPGKFGFQHRKINCGHVSDLHLSPFIYDRLLAVSCIDQSVRIYTAPDAETDDEEAEAPAALHEFRASAGTATTPVLVCWNPQVSGILAVGSGTKFDIFSVSSGSVEITKDIPSPIVTMDWSHDGSRLDLICKDAILRIYDVRSSELVHEVKLTGSKHVLKALADKQFVVSSLSRMRERELNLYSLDEPSRAIKTWNFGTASTPLIPIPDTVRKIVYLLDKSGGTLRWIEMISPYNEGAAGTSVDQASNGCLIHAFGLQIMEGEINRILIADTKGNTVPVKVTIGRKSYVEFHDDIFTPVPVESVVSGSEWLGGQNSMAMIATVNPSLIAAAERGDSLTKHAIIPNLQTTATRSQAPSEAPVQKKSPPSENSQEPAAVLRDEIAPNAPSRSQTAPVHGSAKPASTLSAREQRKWDKEEAQLEASSANRSREVFREDLNARRAEYGAPTTRGKSPDDDDERAIPKKEDEVSRSPQLIDSDTETPIKETKDEEAPSIGRGPAPVVDNEDALERIRSRRVTPAIEAQESSQDIKSPQPQREVYREDLGSRRSEYGAPSAGATREVFKEDLGARRAEYGARPSSRFSEESKQTSAPSPSVTRPEQSSQTHDGSREVYREDLSSRRAEYGAPTKLGNTNAASILKPSTPTLSAREQRKWDKEASRSASETTVQTDSQANSGEVIEKNASAVPSGSEPERTTTAEREVFREDLRARRAEYGAVTPKLDEPSTAYKELTRALGKAPPKVVPEPASETVPYMKEDPAQSEATREELENVYAPPIEETKLNEKRKDVPVEKSSSIVEKVPAGSISPAASATKEKSTEDIPLVDSNNIKTPSKKLSPNTLEKGESRDYTRKYLQGKPQHPRNSYTSLIGLNASLPNTARLIDATPKHIAVPLAGPGGRIAIIRYEQSGRLPPLLLGVAGGAQVVDFQLDRFKSDRLVSAHIDQTVKVWTIPRDLSELETDIDTPDRVLKGMDRILAISLHAYAKNLLMVTTSAKVHLFDIEDGEELHSFSVRGIANTCWSLDGTKIAIGKSDKSIVIIEAGTGREIQNFASAHTSTRPFRLQFVGGDRLITAGFGRGSVRQLALYDSITGKELQVHDMDISPSPFALPHFDEMTNILYLVPRGSSNVLPFHIRKDDFSPLTTYSAADPIMGTVFLAPQDLAIREIEVARCLRLSTNEITVVGFHIPRPAGEFFHDDIYPRETRDVYTSNIPAKKWLSGQHDTEQKKVYLNREDLKSASASGIGSIGKKSAGPTSQTPGRTREPPVKKPSELEQMFNQAKNQQDGDEPENINKNKNTQWE